MSLDSILHLDQPAVRVEVSQGKVGGTISTADSAGGNALMLLITNPWGPKVELAACFGERRTGWRGRRRQRFRLPMHGIPHCFGRDGDRCIAWAEAASLPSLNGLTQIYVRDTSGNEWPVENVDTLLRIAEHLNRPRSIGDFPRMPPMARTKCA